MIETLHLFPELDAGLHELLSSLRPEEWSLPTVHRNRSVKDLASHLADTALRRVAMQRDGWFTEPPSDTSWQGLVDFIQQANASWITATRRLSPRMLIELSRRAHVEMYEVLRGLDPHGNALFPVAWAGETQSENWFDIAREYTERWHHQQQLRDAVGRPGFAEPRFLRPVIETFARGLPHAYRDAPAAARIVVDGEIYVTDPEKTVEATLELSSDVAWRLWTRSMDAATARAQARTTGRESLLAPAFAYVAIMA